MFKVVYNKNLQVTGYPAFDDRINMVIDTSSW